MSLLPGQTHVILAPDVLAAATAQWILARAADAVDARGVFSIALAGGSTPRATYEHLAESVGVAWEQWVVFFGDERACPMDDPASNYAMARAALLDHVAVPPDHVHRMPADSDDLDGAAAWYSQDVEVAQGSPPVIDVVLLGLGENGHTASLFPGTASLDVTDAWCTRGLADYEPFDRLTLTYPAINGARQIAFLVSGGSKRDALCGIVDGTVPAAGIRPTDGELHWFLDEAAAATLPG